VRKGRCKDTRARGGGGGAPAHATRTALIKPSSRASNPRGSSERTASTLCKSEDSYNTRRNSSLPAAATRAPSSAASDSSAHAEAAGGAECRCWKQAVKNWDTASFDGAFKRRDKSLI